MNDFETKGYILNKDFFDINELSLLNCGANYLKDIPEIIGGPMKYFEKSKIDGSVILNRVENFCDFVPLLDSILLADKIKNLLRNLTGREYILFKEKINYKLPGAGGFLPHQDGSAFRKFVDDELITIMIPMSVAKEINGCLRIASYSYKKKLIQHSQGCISDNYYEAGNSKNWCEIIMNPGDILCFSSYLVHCSNDNFSKIARTSYFVTYSPKELESQREKYFQYKRNKFPPRIERNQHTDYTFWKKNLAREIL